MEGDLTGHLICSNSQTEMLDTLHFSLLFDIKRIPSFVKSRIRHGRRTEDGVAGGRVRGVRRQLRDRLRQRGMIGSIIKIREILQGEYSGCSLGVVDIKTKVAF